MRRPGRSTRRGPSEQLQQALREAFPDDEVLEGLSFRESGRSFGMNLDPGWSGQAAGVRLSPPVRNGEKQPQCDALFIVCAAIRLLPNRAVRMASLVLAAGFAMIFTFADRLSLLAVVTVLVLSRIGEGPAACGGLPEVAGD